MRRPWVGQKPAGRGFPARLLLTAILVPLVACTAQSAPLTATAQQAGSSADGIPSADEQAIRATIDRLNTTAAGSVADQQAAFAAAVNPGSTAALDDCPAATATLRFLPVYPALRANPDWTPKKGELTGTVYALPTLIRIYTGDRVTATDLTTLHLGVTAGEAFLTPLCVS